MWRIWGVRDACEMPHIRECSLGQRAGERSLSQRALLCAFRQSCTWDLSISIISNGGAVKANFKHNPGALVSPEQDRRADGPSRSLRMGQLRSCCCLGVTAALSDSTALPLLHTGNQLLSLHKDGRALSVVSLRVLRMFDTYFSGFVFLLLYAVFNVCIFTQAAIQHWNTQFLQIWEIRHRARTPNFQPCSNSDFS